MHFNELYRYTKSGYSKLVEKSGIVKKKLIKFNVGLTGTVGSLNVSNMSMKSKEIYEILIEQLRKYKELHVKQENVDISKNTVSSQT